MKNKLKLLKELRSFENMNSIKYEIVLHKKKKLYNDLKEKVNMIKEESSDLYNQMENMKTEQKNKKLLMMEHEEKNKKYLKEINSMIRDNMNIKVNLKKSMRILNVETVNEIIEICNKKKYFEESLNMQFQNLNKELNFLNTQLTEFQKEIHDIENYINEKHANTENTEPNEDIKSSHFDCELENIRKSNMQLFEKVRNTDRLINKVCKNIMINDDKLNSVIHIFQRTQAKKLYANQKSQKNLFNLNPEENAFSLLVRNIIKNKNSNNFDIDSGNSNIDIVIDSSYKLHNFNNEKSYPILFDYSVDSSINKKSGIF